MAEELHSPSILTACSQHTNSTLSALTVTGWLLWGALGGFIKPDLLPLLSNGREVWEVWRRGGHTSPVPLGVASSEMAGAASL